MAPFGTLCAVVTTIFIATKLICCQNLNTNKDGTRNIVPIPTKDNSNDDPLPSEIFKRPVTDFLSPEIFSQSNPLEYFLAKAEKYSEADIRITNQNVDDHLYPNQFPKRYIPYARILLSLLRCLTSLQPVNSSIVEIQNTTELSYFQFPLPSDIPAPDARIAALFSKDIFADDTLPSVLLHKLLDIPEENDIIEAQLWLMKLLNSRKKISRNYRDYMQKLYTFLFTQRNIRNDLKRLKRRVDELKRTISTFNSVDSNRSKI